MCSHKCEGGKLVKTKKNAARSAAEGWMGWCVCVRVCVCVCGRGGGEAGRWGWRGGIGKMG